MKIDQGFIEYKFKGFGTHSSKCNIHFKNVNEIIHILFEDIDEGTSVTNASEQLATDMVNRFELNPDDCRFFETYWQYEYECIDEIKYTWTAKAEKNKINWIASNPNWENADIKLLKHFINR